MITATKITYDKYPAYKDSGVEWLGDIPEHWEVVRLANIGRFSASGIDKLLKKGESKVKIINYTDVYRNPMFTINKETNLMIVTTPESNRINNLVGKGDLIFLPSSETFEDLGLSALVDEELENTSFSYHVLRFKFSRKLDHNFKKYVTNNNKVLLEFSKKGTGSIRKTLSRNDFRNALVILPPIHEQEKIAEFLDEKTEKINRAIAQKEKMIALLKERKQIIIQDLVTGKKVWNAEKNTWTTPKKTKDSGVEWIGEIPENWEVKKLFGLSTFIRGNSSFSKDELQNTGDYIALQYGKVYQIDEIDENYEFYVDGIFYKNSQTVTNGDVVLISTSETIEDLGHSAYYKRNDVGLLGGEQIVLKPNIKKINPHYLFYSTRVFTKELRKFATGIKVYRFNINDLKTIYLPLPSSQEQSLIVSQIEEQSAKIDKAIDLQAQQIEKLKELKSTLIDSAVTGKIRVSSLQEIKVSDYAE